MANTTEVRVGSCSILLVGTIPGFVPDGDRVQSAYDKHQPDAVALGIPPEDVDGLAALATNPSLAEEFPEPSPQDERFFSLLEPWGQTRVPSPDLDAAYARATSDGAPVSALDLDDEAHSSLYIKTVNFRTVIRSGRLLKKLLKATFDAADAYDLAVQWDRFQNRLKPLMAVEAAREEHMANGLRALAKDHARVLAVVHVARLEGVVDALSKPADHASSEP